MSERLKNFFPYGKYLDQSRSFFLRFVLGMPIKKERWIKASLHKSPQLKETAACI